MPVTLKHERMKIKDPTTGQYQTIDIMSDATLAERVAALGEAAETQIDNIEAAGEAVIESLPEDYTELEEDVSQLKYTLQAKEQAKKQIVHFKTGLNCSLLNT